MQTPEVVRQGKGHAESLRVPHFVVAVDFELFSDSSVAAPLCFQFQKSLLNPRERPRMMEGNERDYVLKRVEWGAKTILANGERMASWRSFSRP